MLCEVDFFIQEPSLERDSKASYDLTMLPSPWGNELFNLEGQLGFDSISPYHSSLTILSTQNRNPDVYRNP